MNIDLNLIVESIPEMLSGFGTTLYLLLISGFLGLLLAIVLLLMRISGKFYLDFPAQIYIYIFRGTPILVQIFIIYYGLPQFEYIQDSIFWIKLREPTGCAVLALTLNTGAYVSEILRGGVLAVNRGLIEAGSALGMNARHRFIYITTPIAIRIALPSYSNDVISLLKLKHEKEIPPAIDLVTESLISISIVSTPFLNTVPHPRLGCFSN